MGAFDGAVKIGAQAIETDVHLTKDNVVVLSHDATLKRCFGRPEKLLDVDWSLVSTLSTLAEPKQHMPRLQDLLEYLAAPGREDIWLVLDIKVSMSMRCVRSATDFLTAVQMDNDADDIMRLIAQTISLVPSNAKIPWSKRIILGCWAAKYIPLATKYLAGFPITHIGFSLAYARQFLEAPNVSFNMLLQILMAPGGRKFIDDCKKAGRPVLAWTVNTEEKMKWCIRNEIDGVMTDDPKLFLEVCRRYEGREEKEMRNEKLSWSLWIDVIRIWLMAYLFGFLYRNRFAIKQRLS